MHVGFTALIILFVLNRALQKGLTCLNLRYLQEHGDTIPVGFEGSLDLPKLQAMRDYALARGKVGVAASLWRDVLVGFFFFGGPLPLYSDWINGLGLSALPSVLLFFILLSYADTLFGLPFQLFSTFRVEQRFGFNRQTKKLWLSDFGKSVGLGTLLLGLLLSAAYLLIDSFPHNWWLAVWLLFCFFSLLMLYLVPHVIEPLFNTFSPIADPLLEQCLRDLMAKAGLHISRVFCMDASKRSGHSNAYFSGLGRVKRIVLFDTLLAGHSHAEIAAILAHEAGHWKKKHILRRLFLGAVIVLILCYLLQLLSSSVWLTEVFRLGGDEVHVRLLVAGFLLSLFGLPLSPLTSWYSRRHEREADRFALSLLGDPSSLAAALVKLGVENLANLHPHPLYAKMFYSHPPLVERVQGLLQSKEGAAHG